MNTIKTITLTTNICNISKDGVIEFKLTIVHECNVIRRNNVWQEAI